MQDPEESQTSKGILSDAGGHASQGRLRRRMPLKKMWFMVLKEHCADIYGDPEEDNETQERRIKKIRGDGN